MWPRKRTVKNHSIDNPMKKQTKPEVKKQLDEFVSAVKKDEGNTGNGDIYL